MLNKLLEQSDFVEFGFESFDTVLVPLGWVTFNEFKLDDINKNIELLDVDIDISEYRNKDEYNEKFKISKFLKKLNCPNLDSLDFIKKSDELDTVIKKYKLPYNTCLNNEDTLYGSWYNNFNANISYNDYNSIKIRVIKNKNYNNIYDNKQQIDYDLVGYIGLGFNDGYKLFLTKDYFKTYQIQLSSENNISSMNLELDLTKFNSYEELNEYFHLEHVEDFQYKYNNSIYLNHKSEEWKLELAKTLLKLNDSGIVNLYLLPKLGTELETLSLNNIKLKTDNSNNNYQLNY